METITEEHCRFFLVQICPLEVKSDPGPVGRGSQDFRWKQTCSSMPFCAALRKIEFEEEFLFFWKNNEIMSLTRSGNISLVAARYQSREKRLSYVTVIVSEECDRPGDLGA